jgi:hypothetical protein
MMEFKDLLGHKGMMEFKDLLGPKGMMEFKDLLDHKAMMEFKDLLGPKDLLVQMWFHNRVEPLITIILYNDLLFVRSQNHKYYFFII